MAQPVAQPVAQRGQTHPLKKDAELEPPLASQFATPSSMEESFEVEGLLATVPVPKAATDSRTALAPLGSKFVAQNQAMSLSQEVPLLQVPQARVSPCPAQLRSVAWSAA